MIKGHQNITSLNLYLEANVTFFTKCVCHGRKFSHVEFQILMLKTLISFVSEVDQS